MYMLQLIRYLLVLLRFQCCLPRSAVASSFIKKFMKEIVFLLEQYFVSFSVIFFLGFPDTHIVVFAVEQCNLLTRIVIKRNWIEHDMLKEIFALNKVRAQKL